MLYAMKVTEIFFVLAEKRNSTNEAEKISTFFYKPNILAVPAESEVLFAVFGR